MTDFDDALKALQGPDEILDTAREAEFHPLKANTAILGAYYNLSIALGWYLHNDEAPINATFPTFAAWSAQSLRADVAEDDEGGYLSGEPDASGLWLGRRLYDVVTNAVLTDRGAIARNIALRSSRHLRRGRPGDVDAARHHPASVEEGQGEDRLG